jgi:hypothetical protein
MSKQDLQISIVQTLAFFAVIHRALTKEELKHNLWKIDMCANEVFESTLQQFITEKTISKQDGYYGLNTKHIDTAKLRRSLIPNFTPLIKKTTQLFEYIPWVEDVYLVNSVSFGAPHEGSDLDLLVVCKDNLIWLTRVWTTFIFWIHGLWRYGDDIEGKVCLSFFITKSHQDLSSIQLDDIDDIYLIYWILFAQPIFTRGTSDICNSNQWVFEYVPNSKNHIQGTLINDISQKTTEEYSVATAKEGSLSFFKSFFFIINSLLKRILLPRHQRKFQLASKHSSVIISDTMLKFHENDRRKRFWEEWKKQTPLT